MNKEELEFKVNQIIYRKVFNEDECNKIIECYHNRELTDSISTDYNFDYQNKDSLKNLKDNKSRISKESALFSGEDEWVHDKVSNILEELNDKFFNFDSLKMGRYQLLQYGPNGKFDWHADQGLKGVFSLRRISIVIFLSNRDEYEGGQLEFMPKLREPLKMEKGYMVVFPSHKIHRVSPIISGIRRTIVNWSYEATELLKYQVQ